MLEGGPVVVDVRQGDGDGGAGGQSSAEAQHVLHLHHHQVLVPGLPVHVGPGSDDDTCRWAHGGVLSEPPALFRSFLTSLLI